MYTQVEFSLTKPLFHVLICLIFILNRGVFGAESKGLTSQIWHLIEGELTK